MKTIDGLLSHIDKITHDARSGDHQDKNGQNHYPPAVSMLSNFSRTFSSRSNLQSSTTVFL